MAGKVTNQQVNQANFNVDAFRSAVNYVNTKNKGYVRFEPDGRGGVKVAKVNNKIDIKIGWRTNIDSVKNQAMRQKFANSIQTGLRWADQAQVQKILDKILKAPQGGVNRTDPLSRKEIEKALGDYDKIMNTPYGRMKIVDSIIKDAALRCGLGGTDEAIKEFKAKYLKLPSTFGGFDGLYASNDGVERGKPGYMKMDELTFKNRLQILELACKEAVDIGRLDTTLRVKAEGLAGGAPGDIIGLNMSDAEKADFHASLRNVLERKGVLAQYDNGVNGDPGTKGMLLNKFVNDVLPELFKKNVENVRAYGKDADAKLQIEANFSFEAIVEDAEAFLAGAAEFIKNPPKREVKQTGIAGVDNYINNLKQTLEMTNETVKFAQIRETQIDLLTHANISKQEAHDIANGMRGAMKAFDAEGALATFTKQFLAERGIGEGVAEKDVAHDVLKKTIDAIVQTGFKVKIAAQMQNGTVKYDAGTGARSQTDNGMGAYIKDLEDSVNEIAAGKSGTNLALVSKLLSFTLANIASRKVDMVAHGIGVAVKIDKAAEAEDAKALKATADTYLAFEKTVEKTINSEMKAFTKLAKAQVKAGLIDDGQLNNLLALAKQKFNKAHMAAVEAYFRQTPFVEPEDGARLLKRVFTAKLAEARAELNNNLAVNSMGRTIGIAQKGELMKVEDRVAEALAQKGMAEHLAKLGVQGVIGEKEAKSVLEMGALKRLYTSVLAEKLKSVPKVDGHRTITDKFVDDVKKTFNSKALDLVKKAAKCVSDKSDGFVEMTRKGLNDSLLVHIEEGHGAFKGYETEEPKITKDERKTLAKEMATEVMTYKARQVKESILEILETADTIKAGKVPELVDNFLNKDGPENVGVAITKVAEERAEIVDKFMKDGFKAAKKVAGTSGVFGEKGVLKDVFKGPFSEGDVLLNKAAKKVESRMKARPHVYATNDQVALKARVVAEIDKAAQGFASKWAAFRAKFMVEADKLAKEFGSLGKDKIDSTLRWVLSELASRDDFDKIDLKMAVGYYRQELTDTLNHKVDSIKMSFETYVKKIDAVHGKAMESIKDACDLILGQAEALGTPEAVEHLKNNVLPEFVKRMEYEIYAKPDDFDSIEKRDAFAKKIDDTFGKAVIGVLVTSNPVFGAKKLIEAGGAGVLLQDNAHKAEADAAKKTLSGWLASPEGHALHVAAEKALLDHALESYDSYPGDAKSLEFVPSAKDNDVVKFRDAIRDLLRGHAVKLLYTAFDNSKVGEAKAAFETWLDSHAIAKFEDYRKTTSRDRIMKMFNERIAELQKGALEAPDKKNEPILTPAFIDAVDQVIDSDGAQALLSDWQLKQKEYWIGELSKHQAWSCFNIADPAFATMPENLKAVVVKNNMELMGALSISLTNVGASADGKAGIDATRKALDSLDMDEIKRRINGDLVTVLDRGFRRFNLATGSAKVVETYSHAIERDIIRHVFGSKAENNFKGGLDDVLVFAEMHPEVLAKHPKLKDAIIDVKNSIADLFTQVDNFIAERDQALAEFTSNVKNASNIFVNRLYDDKPLWKNILEPALKAVNKLVP